MFSIFRESISSWYQQVIIDCSTSSYSFSLYVSSFLHPSPPSSVSSLSLLLLFLFDFPSFYSFSLIPCHSNPLLSFHFLLSGSLPSLSLPSLSASLYVCMSLFVCLCLSIALCLSLSLSVSLCLSLALIPSSQNMETVQRRSPNTPTHRALRITPHLSTTVITCLNIRKQPESSATCESSLFLFHRFCKDNSNNRIRVTTKQILC